MPPAFHPTDVILKQARSGYSCRPQGLTLVDMDQSQLTLYSLPVTKPREQTCDPLLAAMTQAEDPWECVSGLKQTQNEVAPFLPVAVVTSGGDLNLPQPFSNHKENEF